MRNTLVSETVTGSAPVPPSDSRPRVSSPSPARSRLRSRGARSLAAGAVLVLTAAAGCSSDSGSSDPASTSTPGTSAATSGHAADSSGVEVHEAWVRATDKGMTGVFGMIHNHGSAPAHIVSASSSLGGTTQLHQTVSQGGTMQMQEAADGFRIPAGGELELKPGADHIMLMELDKPVTAGQQVQITLSLEGGQTVAFTATGRAFEGGKENYTGGSGAGSSASSSAGAATSSAAAHPEGGHSDGGHQHSHDHG